MVQLQTNLIASAVSNDGKWLAVSDLYETKLFRLQLVRPPVLSEIDCAHPLAREQKNGDICPRRQKTFSTSLSAALPPSLGTGSSVLVFTNDSRRLILATSFGSSIAVVDLPASKEEVFTVVRVFAEHGDREAGREIRGKSVAKTTGDADVEMNGVEHEDSSDEEDEEMESNAGGRARNGDKPATVACMAVSADGKWFASADVERKVCVFDLEALKVRLSS